MKIALLGYGKMGQAIKKIAQAQGHEIVVKKDDEIPFSFQGVDVAIDFSLPHVAVSHITRCFNEGIPVVSGTTGWLDQYETMIALCKEKNGSFIYASNFSIGVNIFFEINKKLAQYMAPHPSYKVAIEEIHHTQKLDAPSGTAITLAEGIIDAGQYTDWKETENASYIIEDHSIPIVSKREGTVPGTHIVTYKNEIDTLHLYHEAHSRLGFAQGALVAALWLVGKKGVFSMADVLNIS
ncbi:4-hydroxy-tetrahydrodipicolinate reductase [uncultured Dokdonia sp.]|uniref:4-hydroxy-tetrahydrodipicolinate reductase n=1 Tax=uncultured Dokdonia sp. TaxID=575653 RepID=UPI00262AEC56|nr:4-hydroxy-tetrahydrodipicolinate reductase [uncultured Dokdonia sp.]